LKTYEKLASFAMTAVILVC